MELDGRRHFMSMKFYHVSRIGVIREFYYLLSALVEKWRQETHIFVLPMGEVTVTLKDVAHILFGLPIDGQLVSDWIDRSDKSMVYAHAKYLPLFRDFDWIHTYNLGSACLAHLYRVLFRVSQYYTKEMDSPLNLLFVWTWKRMPYIAPEQRQYLLVADVPVAWRWSHSEQTVAWLSKTMATFRQEIDYMKEL
ncbi:protein MAIN-LIKE 1-like [Arachis duranensis]|uniref:Protein MAIN-LIKE 1-like n=1 Tax=Arachis duranensis TaxID=130453 RepID=A0A6P4CBL0_ARADU|nr:protein MAIN-LIKE 1-like [Arachis duranensis]